MLIDAITLLILVLAVFKGWRQGLVVALFSFFAMILGLAAAMKFSVATAHWLEGSVNVSARWLPVLSFLLVFIAVVLLVNLVARLIEQTIELAMLGVLNKAGGILLYIVIYLLTWSILLFYLGKTQLLSAKTMEQSNTYPIIAPWGPKVIDVLGEVMPFFKNMFEELSRFFGLF
ncbi:CvpA family protein [Flavihumibacter petaseus]|uniref:CvpA family protein n=1 Tax=Flavihumibacter petaseus NBRC 106054 TaxID=1220578 RepID=A0A0E9N0E6_9BACT|nr:CvpA family protein [Flavihumibacter petaseus]GAO42840.1 hypothetical protein FPE01S_01_18580 [Flavihumibacter petaseus NBRC 106054]